MNEDIWSGDPLQDEKFLESISDNRFHVRIAAFIYRKFFQPISDFFEKRSQNWTRKFCEEKDSEPQRSVSEILNDPPKFIEVPVEIQEKYSK